MCVFILVYAYANAFVYVFVPQGEREEQKHAQMLVNAFVFIRPIVACIN